MNKQILPFLLLTIIISGCVGAPDQNVIPNTVDKFYSQIKAKNFEGTLELFSDEFYKYLSRNDTVKFLELINEKLGNLENYTIISWNVKTFTTTAGNSQTFTLVYNVTYSKHIAVETLILTQRNSKEFKIDRYSVNSRGLLEILEE